MPTVVGARPAKGLIAGSHQMGPFLYWAMPNAGDWDISSQNWELSGNNNPAAFINGHPA